MLRRGSAAAAAAAAASRWCAAAAAAAATATATATATAGAGPWLHAEHRADVAAARDAGVSNAPANVLAKVGRTLQARPGHPVHTIAQRVAGQLRADGFEYLDTLTPVVDVADNFDSLGIPADHVGRSFADTYYLSRTHLLRTHTSAHQVGLLREGRRRFLVAGDVYRRDEIDATHYPVFHQMEGVRLFGEDELPGPLDAPASLAFIEADLKRTLENVFRAVYGGDVRFRWIDAYFPFTDPSWELEVLWNGTWLEVLGCGVIHQNVLRAGAVERRRGWAFGLGLDRIAMLLFRIPDIRLFWTDDDRFHAQFRAHPGEIFHFAPYSRYPECPKDVTFWLPPTGPYSSNDFFEVVREIGGDLVERVDCIDKFKHPRSGRESHCYRIHYRSMDRSLTNDEINLLQEQVRDSVTQRLGAELR